MIIIVGGKPGVHGAMRHAKQEGGVCACKHYVCASLVQNAMCRLRFVLCLCRSVKKSVNLNVGLSLTLLLNMSYGTSSVTRASVVLMEYNYHCSSKSVPQG